MSFKFIQHPATLRLIFPVNYFSLIPPNFGFVMINLINGRLRKGDCALSMMDSTAANGWMRKANFAKQGDNDIQAKACVYAA
jgi:hypothetical protein